MIKKIYFIASMCFSFFAYSQETDLRKIKLAEPILNKDSILQVGIKLHDDKKYDESIIEFEKINENDSNYVLAQLEIANTYSALKKDSMVIKITNAIVTDLPSNIIEKMLLQARAYEGLKDYNMAQSIYTKGATQFPLCPRFYHENAISLFNQKKYKETEEYFLKALSVNPNYPPTHYQLAFFALKQKKIIPAMLAFQYYLLLDNSSTRAQNVINFIQQIGDDAVKYEDMDLFEPIDENDDFSDIESIVRSKAAYSDKFKSKVKINYRVLKQIQVVLDKLEFNPSDKGFYNNYYAKYFKDMVDNKFTETYMYYILSEMQMEDVNKWAKSNKSDIEKFGKWHAKYLKTNRYATKLNGKDTYKYINDNELSGIGNYDENNNVTGYWQFYFSKTGVLKSEGNYNDKYERDGKWTYYYPNGQIKEACNFKNDKLEGEYFKYANNGKLLKKLNYKDGKYDGLQTLYHINGSIKNTYTYVNDIITGEETEYHPNGKIMYKTQLVEQRYSGNVLVYYNNGSLQKSINFLKGTQVGKAIEYYQFPKEVVSGEGNYENNQPVGEWKYYNENGKLSSVGVFNKNGLKDGIWKDYDAKGNLISEDNYADGKYEGASKNYYPNGKIYEEYIYRKNKINAYKYFDKTGQLVKEFNKQRKDFSFELYNKNGTIRSTGKLVDDAFDGTVNNYNYLGVKYETKEYKNEKKVNKELTYFTNGKLHEENPIVDGKIHGLFTEYFVNGKIITQGYMVNDVAQGYWFYYDRRGSLNDIKYFVNGEQYGWQRTFACNGKVFKAEFLNQGYILKRCYYDTLGNITQRLNYDSINEFTFTVPNFDGNVAYKRPIKNNYLNGTSFNYYPNGKVHTERTYEMDKENGLSKSYDVYGNVYKEENYNTDKLNGKYITYDNKNKEYEATYLNNKLTGEAIDYYYTGKPYVKTTYEYDIANGPQTYLDQTGNTIIVKNYVRDNIVSYSYEGENGQMIEPIEINKPDMNIKSLFKNKKTAMQYTLKYGDKEGLLLIYDINGGKITEENYSDGYLNGPRITYYPNGIIKSKTTFYYGKFNGLYTEYYENGNKKEELNFSYSNRHGICSYYDINGKKIYSYLYYDDSAYKTVK